MVSPVEYMNAQNKTIEFQVGSPLPKDDVSNPAHYTLGSIEVIDFIEAWELDFREGNVIKYTVRAPYKGNRLKDLEKARWYLDRLIEEEIAATTPDIKEVNYDEDTVTE